MKLSCRLETVASFVDKGSIAADVGTDHGYIPIALVEEGDLISIDIPNCSIRLEVPEEELQRREAAWVCPEPKVKTGYLARYAKMVTSADKGAILDF